MKNPKELRKKCIKSGLIRGGVAALLTVWVVWSVYSQGDSEHGRMLLAIGIIVTAILGFMPIYDYDVWSVRKKILIHTLAMFVTIYPALLISGWYGGDFGYLFALGSFALFGVIFMTVGYLLSKYVFKNIPDSK